MRACSSQCVALFRHLTTQVLCVTMATTGWRCSTTSFQLAACWSSICTCAPTCGTGIGSTKSARWMPVFTVFGPPYR